MSNDVVLSAALRNNLLSLQQTQKQIDTHQTRLATGKKVNSALDNPQSFFAAQSLTNRANDLSNLLDAIGQSIQVINAANNGVSALTTLINQAQSVAQTAQSTLAGSSNTAKETGTVVLDGTAKISTLSGFAASGDSVKITITDPSGSATNPLNGVTVSTLANDTINDFVTRINDQNTLQNLSTQAIKASLDSSGHLVFEAVNGGTLHVQFISATAGATAATAVATSLGFGTIAKTNQNGNTANTTDTVDFTTVASSSISSRALYTNATGNLAQATTLLSALKDSSGNAITNITAAGDELKIKVGGKLSGALLNYTPAGGVALTALTATVGSLVDAINHDTTINSLVSASFDASTGKISITAKDSSATDIQIQFTGASGQSFSLATAAYPSGIGFGTSVLTTGTQTFAQEDVRFGQAAGTIASLQTQYNTVLTQIDALVGDTGYAGTNLLNGNNLTTYFNETRTSSLTTSGVTFNSSGLGLKTGNFQSASTITTAINQTISALTTVRNFGSTLSNNLSIIQNRQDFTNNLINTLKTGSDALTNADQNEEGASLLALQTRQSLGITSLSLASQAQQAILKLF